MKKKAILKICACLLGCTLLFAACGETGGGETAEVGSLTAEVGIEFTVPEYSFSNASGETTVRAYAADGAEIPVRYGKVVFPAVGDCKLVWESGGKTFEQAVKVTDSTAPQFEQILSGYYEDNLDGEEKIKLYAYSKENFDMKEYFRATDNSGSCTMKYEALRGGVTPATVENGVFYAENADYYTLIATATDASGNSASLRYRVYMRPRNVFMNFDFRSSEMGEWLYDSTQGSSSQNNEASVYLRENAGLTAARIYGEDGMSYHMHLDATQTPAGRIYRLLLNPSHSWFAFEETKKISYPVLIESDTVAKGTAVPASVVPLPVGLSAADVKGSSDVKVGEWAVLTVENPTFTGTALSLVFQNAWTGGAQTYDIYIDDVTAELPPEITSAQEMYKYAVGDRVAVADLGIEAVCGTTGESLETTFTVQKDGAPVATESDGFTAAESGAYYVTFAATSDLGYTSEKTVLVIAGDDAVAPEIRFNAAYSEEDGYYLEVPAGMRVRVKDFAATVTDNFEGTLSDYEIKVTNKAGNSVSFASATYQFKYEYILAAEDEVYTVSVTASDSSGNVAAGSMRIIVTDELNVSSFDLLDVANESSQHETWINTSATKNHSYEYSDFTEYGFGYSYHAYDIAGVAEVALFADAPNDKQYNRISMMVYIAAEEQLTAQELQVYTPKPSVSGWTCEAYPAAANGWYRVVFTNQTPQTHATWLAGGPLLLGGTAKDANVEVYIDSVAYGTV